MLSLNSLLFCKAILNLPLQCPSIFYVLLLLYSTSPRLPQQQFYILVPAYFPCLSSTAPASDTKDPSSSEVHHLLPYHRSATYIFSKKGRCGTQSQVLQSHTIALSRKYCLLLLDFFFFLIYGLNYPPIQCEDYNKGFCLMFSTVFSCNYHCLKPLSRTKAHIS